jgi:hypothetical protein
LAFDFLEILRALSVARPHVLQAHEQPAGGHASVSVLGAVDLHKQLRATFLGRDEQFLCVD